MIGDRRVLGLIPARGGSKGVPRKNLHPLAGKPLLRWTAEAALASRYIDRVILSTDDDEIAQLGSSLGVEVPFRRPASLASDAALAVDVVRHAIASLEERFDYLLYLEPTSPLRLPQDIDACLERLAARDGDFCVSVSLSPERPEWMFFLTGDGRLEPVIGRFDARPRQDLPACYVFNGAVYAARVDAFLRDGSLTNESTLAHVMPIERGIDVNTQADFDVAEAILVRLGANPG